MPLPATATCSERAPTVMRHSLGPLLPAAMPTEPPTRSDAAWVGVLRVTVDAQQ